MAWHEERSLHLAQNVEGVDRDVDIDTTGRSVSYIAWQLRAVLEWKL